MKLIVNKGDAEILYPIIIYIIKNIKKNPI